MDAAYMVWFGFVGPGFVALFFIPHRMNYRLKLNHQIKCIPIERTVLFSLKIQVYPNRNGKHSAQAYSCEKNSHAQ